MIMKTQANNIYLELQTYIKNADNFLITTHINPDGDAISSVLLFAVILDHFKKQYRIVLEDSVPDKFDFLPGVEKIEHFDSIVLKEYDYMTALDASDLGRIGTLKETITDNVKIINIDHHTSNVYFGNINLIESDKSSTVEIVYRIFSSFDIPLTKDIATLIYTGIMCDTGRFLFPNTNSNSFKVAACMITAGAVPHEIGRNVYYRVSPDSMHLLSKALTTLDFHFNNKVSSIYLTQDSSSKNGKIDTEGFVDYLMTIDRTEVQLFFQEVTKNVFKLSLRSRSYVDVNEIAKHFDGGGHLRASGCHIKGEIGRVKHKVLEVIKEYI
ncbi:MAG: bifunctional oligoribonuclease/PAP phosphatase NrnA [bacterium]